MRTRIRHEVLPVIETACGPDVKNQILRSSALFAADDELLELEAANAPIVPVPGGISIPLGPLRSLPVQIASRVVRRALRVTLDGHPGSADDIDAVMDVAAGGSPVTISGAHHVVRESPFVSITRKLPESVDDGFAVRVGGRFSWHRTQYSTRLADEPPPSIGGGRFTLLGERAVGDEFHVRGLAQGDRIDIGCGSTPAKELLRSAGVPSRIRPHSLVVTVDGRIAALVHVRVASWARASIGDPTVIIEREEGTWK
jgi:hypothetical protein